MPIEMTSLLELPDGSHLRVNAGNGLDLRGLWGATRETRYTDGSPGAKKFRSEPASAKRRLSEKSAHGPNGVSTRTA